jgi:hypothetical protein
VPVDTSVDETDARSAAPITEAHYPVRQSLSFRRSSVVFEPDLAGTAYDKMVRVVRDHD